MIDSENHIYNEIIDSDRLHEIACLRYHITPAFSNNVSSATQKLTRSYGNFLEIIAATLSHSHDFPNVELHQFPIQIILNYLERTHRMYLQKILPEIDQTIQCLRNNNDNTHPYLLLIDMFFVDYSAYLTDHIHTEENTLFPYVKCLLDTKQENIPLLLSYSKIGQYCLEDFFHEHTDTEGALYKVRQSICAYKPPKTDHSLYRILLTQLKTLEIDLSLHTRIEEEVLIPKAIELEKEVKAKFIAKLLQN